MPDNRVRMGEDYKDYNKEVEQLFEKCAKNLKKNVNHSQVLLKLSKDEKSLTKAEGIIKNLRINILNTKIFNFPKDSVSFALFKLNVADVREVVLALTEQGYIPIKGYNASSLKELR